MKYVTRKIVLQIVRLSYEVMFAKRNKIIRKDIP